MDILLGDGHRGKLVRADLKKTRTCYLPTRGRRRKSGAIGFDCRKTSVPAPLLLPSRANVIAAGFWRINRSPFYAPSIRRPHLSNYGRHRQGLKKEKTKT